MANDKLKQNFKDIANSIRAKTGKNGTIKADEMSAEIDSIPVGIEPEGTKEIRNNGDFNIREFENVHVDVPGATTKELFKATENGTYDIAEYANVKVEVPNPSTGTKNITANGNYDVTNYANADVNIRYQQYNWYPIDGNGNIMEDYNFIPEDEGIYQFYGGGYGHTSPYTRRMDSYKARIWSGGCAYRFPYYGEGDIYSKDVDVTELQQLGSMEISYDGVYKAKSSEYIYFDNEYGNNPLDSLGSAESHSGGFYQADGNFNSYGSGHLYELQSDYYEAFF